MSDNLFALLGYRLHAKLDKQRRNEKSLALLSHPITTSDKKNVVERYESYVFPHKRRSVFGIELIFR